MMSPFYTGIMASIPKGSTSSIIANQGMYRFRIRSDDSSLRELLKTPDITVFVVRLENLHAMLVR